MISSDYIQKLATKHQTTELNIQREYLQHLFLASLYRHRNSGSILFKGGTALKFIYGSPRFSEDLDFSGINMTKKELESLLLDTLSQVEREQVEVEINEAKITSGGYLAIYRGRPFRQEIKIQLEISFRNKEDLKAEPDLINQDFIPPYTLIHLSEAQIVREKINALLERSQPRDWYDLYFILRSRMKIDQRKLGIKQEQFKSRLLEKLDDLKTTFLERDLKPLLPVSHHPILKGFKENLKKEIKRYL